MRYRFGRSYYMGPKFDLRCLFYEDLNAAGKLFVDEIAAELERNFKAQRKGSQAFGPAMAREVALALLEHFWSGEDFIPGEEGVKECVELQVTMSERMVV